MGAVQWGQRSDHPPPAVSAWRTCLGVHGPLPGMGNPVSIRQQPRCPPDPGKGSPHLLQQLEIWGGNFVLSVSKKLGLMCQLITFSLCTCLFRSSKEVLP